MSQQKAASLTSALFARKGAAAPASATLNELQRGEAPVLSLVPPPPSASLPSAATSEDDEQGAPHPAQTEARDSRTDGAAEGAADDAGEDRPAPHAESVAANSDDRLDEAPDDSVCDAPMEGDPAPAASLTRCDPPRHHARRPERSAAATMAAAGMLRAADRLPVAAALRRPSWPLVAGLGLAGLVIGVGLYFALVAGERGVELAVAPPPGPAAPSGGEARDGGPASADPEAPAQAMPERAESAETTAAAPGAKATASAGGAEETGTVAAPAAPAETETTPAPAAAASFDVVRIEPNGESLLAGRAPPYSEWIVLNNGEPIGSFTADGVGQWLLLPGAAVTPGGNRFSLVPKAEQGGIAVPAIEPSAETPAGAEPAAAAPTPAGAGEVGDRETVEPAASPTPEPAAADDRQSSAAPASPETEAAGAAPAAAPLPQRKPDGRELAAASTPVVPVAAQGGDGAYEIQIASVRSASDAARERERLLGQFSAVLSPLELRVDEAEIAGSGVYFRIRGGPLASLGEARALCRELEAGGQDCLVVKN